MAPKTPMSENHKAALAEGREQGRAVRNYLNALEATRPKRGRKRTTDSIKNRLERIDEEIIDAKAVKRLELIQERMNLTNELETKEETVDMTALEEAFVEAASEYGDRKGLSYAAWREAGVNADVLKRAGIAKRT